MKRQLLAFLFFVSSFNVFAQTPIVYFNFVTHNEETFQWNVPNFYSANRTKLISLSNYFNLKGITWNMQSDWVYLNNVIMQDSTFFPSTGNKNILRWMHEDKGIEMDPHAHESQYIYPDVVHLMDSIGLPESKVIGGTIYNDSNGVNIWTNLVDGQYGIIYPNQYWKPDYMMGGGTPNHVDDLKYFGIWNPQSPTTYLTHDTSTHIRHLGVGCTIKIWDTSTVAEVVAQINDVVDKVQSGQYPSNGFYLQTIFFEQASLNDLAFYNRVIEIADSAYALVASGVAQWKTFTQVTTEWETTYNAQLFQWECGEIVSGVETVTADNIIVYPNPVSEKLTIAGNPLNGDIEIEIFDLVGRRLHSSKIKSFANQITIDVNQLPSGIYFYQIVSEFNRTVTGKFVKE